MKDTDTAKKWLNRYRELSAELEHLYIQYEEEESRATSPASPKLDGMPRAPGFSGDSIGRSVAYLDDLRQEILEAQEQATAVRREITSAIKQIGKGRGTSGADMRAVLRGRYTMCQTWEDVNNMLFGGKIDYLDREDSYMRRVYRLNGEALIEISQLLETGDFLSYENMKKKSTTEGETANEQGTDET